MYFIPQGNPKRKLLVEGLRKSGLASKISLGSPSRFYYGISASRYSEPLDQFDVPLLLSRLRAAGADTELLIFVAGRYAQLNGRPSEELCPSEERKIQMLKATASFFDIPIRVLGTNELWYNSLYWQEVDRMKSTPGIIDEKRSGPLFSEIFSSFEDGIVAAFPPALESYLSPIPAPRLYRLFEVAEAAYLMKRWGIEAKIGPMAEQEYDCFIGSFMDIVQLQQPADFRSTPKRPKPITPYIGKAGEERIFIGDSKADINRKILRLAQRASGQPIFFGGIQNCFVRLSVLALEAAALSNSAPVCFGNRQLSDGVSVLETFSKMGTERLAKLAPVVSECLWAYLIYPLQNELRKRGVEI